MSVSVSAGVLMTVDIAVFTDLVVGTAVNVVPGVWVAVAESCGVLVAVRVAVAVSCGVAVAV